MSLEKHRRRRKGHRLAGFTDLGSPTKNVLLGAGVNVGGSVLVSKIPQLGTAVANVPLIGQTAPGFVLALALAAYNYFTGHKTAAKDIAIGGALPSLTVLLAQTGVLGLVTTDFAAVVPTVQMSDGTSRPLMDAEFGGPPVSVTQGLNAATIH